MTRRAVALDALEPGPVASLSRGHPPEAGHPGRRSGAGLDPARRGGADFRGRTMRCRTGSCSIPSPMWRRRRNLLTNPALDPFGKIPEFKYCAAKVESAPGRHGRGGIAPTQASGAFSNKIPLIAAAAMRIGMALIENTNGSSALAFGIRHDWTRAEIRALFELPFPELMFEAQRIHRQNFDRARCRFRRCCRSRPAAVRKTAPIVRRARPTKTA